MGILPKSYLARGRPELERIGNGRVKAQRIDLDWRGHIKLPADQNREAGGSRSAIARREDRRRAWHQQVRARCEQASRRDRREQGKKPSEERSSHKVFSVFRQH